jgi:hypothetical protein
MLYRYFANDHFRRIAFEGALSVAQSQRENGSFGDQGGGAGIHQWGAYITKPWMAMLATAGVLDYLDLFPDEEPLRRCILRAGDWLMRIRWTRDGFTGWSYQHDFNGKPEFFDFHHNRWTTLPHAYPWHQENLGRVLAYCTLQTDDSAYLDAWAESFATHAAREGGGGDHTVSAAFQYLPRIQAALWRATLTCDGVAVRPFRFGDRTPPDGLVHGPAGALALHWDADGKVRLPDGTIAGEAQA